jgi:hypothetical protein
VELVSRAKRVPGGEVLFKFAKFSVRLWGLAMFVLIAALSLQRICSKFVAAQLDRPWFPWFPWNIPWCWHPSLARPAGRRRVHMGG